MWITKKLGLYCYFKNVFFVLISDDMKDSRKIHQCPVCLKLFSQKNVMDLHMSLHKDNPKVEEIKAVWEEKNSKLFAKESSPFIKDAIKKLKALHCKSCKVTFDTQELFTEHMTLHENTDNQSSKVYITFNPIKNGMKFDKRIIKLNENEEKLVKKWETDDIISMENLIFSCSVVSRIHGNIKVKNGKVFLTDTSTNGTCINDVRMAKNCSVEIIDGCKVQFGVLVKEKNDKGVMESFLPIIAKVDISYGKVL